MMQQGNSQNFSRLEKSLRSSKFHSEFIPDRLTGVSASHTHSALTLVRAKEIESGRVEKFKNRIIEKEKAIPQKLANCLNKPGVASWLNSASGGRLKANYPNLPAASARSVLRDWDTFSGYLGPRRSVAVDYPINPKEIHCGNCYKIAPVHNAFSYDQASYYISLRNQGHSKESAIALSRKKYCSLTQDLTKAERIYYESSDNFDILEQRYESLMSKYNIHDGEITKKERDYTEEIAKLSRKNEKLKRYVHSVEKAHEPKTNIEKEQAEQKLKGKISLILKNILKNRKRVMSVASLNKNTCDIEKEEGHGEEKEIDKSPLVVERSGARFSILAIRPKRKSVAENIDQALMETKEWKAESKDSHTPAPINIIKTESLLLLDEFSRSANTSSLASLRFDPVLIKNSTLIEKSEKIRRENLEKRKKHSEKKIMLKSQLFESLQKILEGKLTKIKQIEEDKKQEKMEHQQCSKQKDREFNEKVKRMKSIKSENTGIESDNIKKNYYKKLEKAERNKKRIEKMREKRLENMRNHYNSQRIFIEMCQSIVK